MSGKKLPRLVLEGDRVGAMDRVTEWVIVCAFGVILGLTVGRLFELLFRVI